MGNPDRLIACLSALVEDAAATPLPPVSLTEAAVRGDVDAVRAFLDAGGDIEERTVGFASPLAAAASRGHLPVVELLIERGASLDPEGAAFPLLAFPIAHRRLQVVERLLKAGAPADKHRSQFRQAVKQRHWDVVDAMLAGGVEAHWLDAREQAALQEFVEREQPRSAAYRSSLQQQQARQFERDRVSPAPRRLQAATRLQLESEAIAQLLREPGLAHARTASATPMLALAVAAGSHRLLQQLLQCGADPNDGGAGPTPLSRAAARSDLQAIDLLLQAGADPNRRIVGSAPALLAAGLAGALDCVDRLLAAGARLRAGERRQLQQQAGGAQAAQIVARVGAAESVLSKPPAAASSRRRSASTSAFAQPAGPTQETVMSESIAGKVFSCAGSFENLTQTGIKMSVEIRGASFTPSVTKKTEVLVVGGKAGAKLDKARELGIQVMDEAAFHALLERIPITEAMKRRYMG